MSPKQQAIRDIKKELKRLSKAFISYRSELDAPIQEIIDEQLSKQAKLSPKPSWVLNAWSFPIKNKNND